MISGSLDRSSTVSVPMLHTNGVCLASCGARRFHMGPVRLQRMTQVREAVGAIVEPVYEVKVNFKSSGIERIFEIVHRCAGSENGFGALRYPVLRVPGFDICPADGGWAEGIRRRSG